MNGDFLETLKKFAKKKSHKAEITFTKNLGQKRDSKRLSWQTSKILFTSMPRARRSSSLGSQLIKLVLKKASAIVCVFYEKGR